MARIRRKFVDVQKASGSAIAFTCIETAELNKVDA
jgi:hypothetical protein